MNNGMIFVPEFILVFAAIVLVFSKNILKNDNWIPMAALAALGLAFFWRLEQLCEKRHIRL